MIGPSWKKSAFNWLALSLDLVVHFPQCFSNTYLASVLCAKYLNTSRSFFSFLISPLFSQGAGGRVILVLRRGAGLSRQDFKEGVKNVYFLAGIINTVYDSRRNTSQFFSEGCPIEFLFTQFLLQGWKTHLLSSNFLNLKSLRGRHSKGTPEEGNLGTRQRAREKGGLRYFCDWHVWNSDRFLHLSSGYEKRKRQKRPCRPSFRAPFALLARPESLSFQTRACHAS